MAYQTIRSGATGTDVRELQNLLLEKGYHLNASGHFDSQTQAAVRDYQQKNNLTVDGIVGNQTWGALAGGGVLSAPAVKTPAAPKTQAGVSGGAASRTDPAATVQAEMPAAYTPAPSYQAPAQGQSYKASTLPAQSSELWQAAYQYNAPTYQQSDAAMRAQEALAAYGAQRPGAYQSSYAQQIDALLNQVMNRPAFSYDFNADPLYQQYAERYQQQGKMAMQDTMANAAALTGGYGNSYAQTAGQQAYHGYLQGLNDVVPELQNAAYRMYEGEGNAMRSNLSALAAQEDMAYGRYRDEVGDYYNQLNYLYGREQDAQGQDWNRYLQSVDDARYGQNLSLKQAQDALSQENWAAQFGYGQQQDALAQENWMRQFDYGREQDALSQSNWQRQFDYNAGQDALSQNNWLAQFNQKQETQGTAQKSAGYDTAVAQIQMMDPADADAYLGRLIENGVVTQEEGARIYWLYNVGQGEGAVAQTMPVTYEGFVKQTGYSGIATDHEFRLRPQLLAQYGNYQAYLEAMYQKYNK